jgi:hypothetical protein
MIMKATHLYGPDDQPRKKSLMAPIVLGLISGGIVCGALTALVAVLRYGTEGHSFPFDPPSRRVTFWSPATQTPLPRAQPRSADSHAQHGVRLSRMRSLHSHKRAT